jgi:hypothetical protein
MAAIALHLIASYSKISIFSEGDEVDPGAFFLSQNHIQLCIVNPNCIIGYFNPISVNDDYKKF